MPDDTSRLFRWRLPEPADASAVARLSGELCCAPSFAALLLGKGMACPEEIRRFLDPQLKTLSDPYRLPEMGKAVERVLAAVDRGSRIVLYGDYDVDGVTSLALLARMLRAYGSRPECFLPSRRDEGYGLSKEGLSRCLETCRPELLIAVDCGTSSVEEIAALARQGVEVIVIDHHECKAELPRCVAVVNPKRTDVRTDLGTSPESRDSRSGGMDDDYRYLCSVGLVFKLCHALLKARPLEAFVLREHLDLVALGTVADIVPLTRENRILVQRGLSQMAKTQWPGLRALMEVAGTKLPLTPGDVGFQLGPRLNAAGRLGTARDALDLLLTDDPSRARTLALALDAQNRDRQEVEKNTLAEAERQVGDPLSQAAIIVGAEGWHPGVLGIVASRICRQHHRPTWVVGFDENGVGKGSGRSIDGLSLVEALGECAPLLEKFGGHEMAAGLTIRRERFEEFRRLFAQAARERLSDDDLLPRVKLDGEMTLGELGLPFLEFHERLQPFGMGNAQPVFIARGVRPLGPPQVMKEKHLRLSLGQNGSRHEAVFFNALADDLPRPPWDVAFRISRNEWRDRVSVQIQVQRIRTAE